MSRQLSQVSWEELSLPHIELLIDHGVPEGRSIEYKRDLYPGSDAGTREFLADVVSLANAQGGHLLIGVDERDSIAVGISGIEADRDDLLPRLDSKIQSSIDPRLVGLRLKLVPINDEKSVLVVRVPHSWARPHMVTFKNLSRCYSRNNAGKYQMDMSEIRSEILGRSALAERLHQFRSRRLSLISAGRGPVQLGSGGKVILHAVPFESLEVGSGTGIPDAGAGLRPLGGWGWNRRINFDGLLTYSGTPPEHAAYLQVFRQGMVETVNSELLAPPHDPDTLYAENLDEKVLESVSCILENLTARETSPPVAWMLTLTGVKGLHISVSNTVRFSGDASIDREELIVPEVIDLDFSMDARSIAKALMDPVWQAGGWSESHTFRIDDGA